MEYRLQHDSRAKGAMGSGSRAKGLVLGLIAGLVATDVKTAGVVLDMTALKKKDNLYRHCSEA